MENSPKCTVETLKYHTFQGQEHQIGDSYEVEESAVENLVAQGMVKRPEAAEAPAKRSQPVEPMTTDDLGGGRKSRK